MAEDFYFDYGNGITNTMPDGTVIHTTFEEISEEKTKKLLLSALDGFEINKGQYSPYTSDSDSERDLTIDVIDELATNINSSLDNVVAANTIIRKQILTNNVIGKTYEAIWSNINSDYRLNYPSVDGRNKQKAIEKAKSIIEDFNQQIFLEQLIRDAIS